MFGRLGDHREAEHRLDQLFPYLASSGTCTSNVIVPAMSQKVPDGPLSTGDPAWLDMLHMGTNVIGAGGPGSRPETVSAGRRPSLRSTRPTAG